VSGTLEVVGLSLWIIAFTMWVVNYTLYILQASDAYNSTNWFVLLLPIAYLANASALFALRPTDLPRIRRFVAIVLFWIFIQGGWVLWGAIAILQPLQQCESHFFSANGTSCALPVHQKIIVGWDVSLAVAYFAVLPPLVLPVFSPRVSGRRALARMWMWYRLYNALTGIIYVPIMALLWNPEVVGFTYFDVAPFSSTGYLSVPVCTLLIALLATPKNRARVQSWLQQLAARGEERQAAAIAHLVGQMPAGHALKLARERFRGLPLSGLQREDFSAHVIGHSEVRRWQRRGCDWRQSIWLSVIATPS
jgi:hypothetical protein